MPPPVKIRFYLTFKQLFLISAFVLPLDVMSQPVSVTYIANEGVLISHGEDQILIDAIHSYYYPEYLPTPDSLLNRMMEGMTPFTSVDAFLVSHVHRDHFDAELSARYLSTHPEVKLFSSQQVLDSVAGHYDISGKLSMNFKRLAYDNEGGNMLEIDDVTIRIFPVQHGGTKWRWIENIGYVVTMNQLSFLHIGDPSFGKTDIERLMKKVEKIDVAILPFWFLTEKDGRMVIDTIIKPKKIIAVHIPPENNEEYLLEIEKSYTEATAFLTPLQSIEFD